ncbi:MAG: UPF0182 family protein [Gemmatimonadota bacterium]|nr:UPF0182 family protein [Gemmatimonadota bacterium]
MRRWLLVLLVAVAIALVAGRWASVIFADWQWFDALGALPVLRSKLMHEMAWRAGAASAGFVFAFVNLFALRRSIVSLVLPRRLGNLEIGEAVPARVLLFAVFALSAVLALLLSSPTGDWTTFALARTADRINEMDPYLDRDLAFAMTWLPFELDLYAWAGRVMVTITVLIVALYALTPSLRIQARGIYVSAYCRRHLVTLAAIGILLLAWRSRIDGLAITSTVRDAANTFGPFDHRVGMPMQTWITAFTSVAAFVVFWGGWHGHPRLVALAGLLAVAGGPLAQSVLPRVTGRSFTESQVRELTRPFDATRRLFTRRAFGVDEIQQADADPPSVNALPARVALWDPAALVRAAGDAAVSGRPTFGLAWSHERGMPRATVVAQPKTSGGRWSATTFDPTRADERGHALPAVPLDILHPTLVGWPELLVHPGASGHVIVADSGGHVPAPAFERTADRLGIAWSLRAPSLVAANAIGPRPKLVYRRDAAERVSALVPFLVAGPTIVPVVRGDSLYWVVELFTTARFYPLADRLIFAGELRSYVHHAATAFVHANTGQVTLAAAPSPDGLMRIWMRRYPTMFLARADLPAGLAAAHPPPVDWAALQATALARTGLGTNSGAARLAVATDNADADLIGEAPALFLTSGTSAPAARAVNAAPELSWSQALLDASGTVAGIVTADGSGFTRWHPMPAGPRWSDLLDQLQKSADSAGIGRQRPGARRGRVQAVPAAGDAAFLQTHYEWGADTPPVVAGVSTVHAGKARAAATMAEALGLSASVRVPRNGAFRAAVEQLHRQMSDAMRRGDWNAFGIAFEALGALLRGGR